MTDTERRLINFILTYWEAGFDTQTIAQKATEAGFEEMSQTPHKRPVQESTVYNALHRYRPYRLRGAA